MAEPVLSYANSYVTWIVWPSILVTISGGNICVTFTVTLSMSYFDFLLNTLRKQKNKKFESGKVFKNWTVKSTDRSIKVCWQSALSNHIVHGRLKITLQGVKYPLPPPIIFQTTNAIHFKFWIDIQQFFFKSQHFFPKMVLIFKIMIRALYNWFCAFYFLRLMFIKIKTLKPNCPNTNFWMDQNLWKWSRCNNLLT